MQQPPLIDEVLGRKALFDSSQTEINDRWYIAKPLPCYGWRNTAMRLYHAWLVLRGKAMAIQYAEDRKGL